MHSNTFPFCTLTLLFVVTLSSALPTTNYTSSQPIERDGQVSTSYIPTIKVPRALTAVDGQVPTSYKPTIEVPRDLIDSVLYTRTIDELNARYGDDYASISEGHSIYGRSINDTLDVMSMDLEPRGGGAGAAKALVKLVKAIVDIIKEKVKEDNDAREKFTKETVANSRQKFPHFNWVVCHTKHETKFDGDRGEEWGHSHHEVDIKIGGTIGYEIYWFKSGMFHREGDGGFINWAWMGDTKDVEDNGSHIDFSAPA